MLAQTHIFLPVLFASMKKKKINSLVPELNAQCDVQYSRIEMRPA
jgi:hypothetical protein